MHALHFVHFIIYQLSYCCVLTFRIPSLKIIPNPSKSSQVLHGCRFQHATKDLGLLDGCLDHHLFHFSL